MNSTIGLPAVKQVVILGVTLCLLVTVYSLVRYPTILIIIVVTYVALAMRLTRNPDADTVWLAH